MFHRHYGGHELEDDPSAEFLRLGLEVGFELASQVGMELAIRPADLTPGEYLSLKAHDLGKQKADAEKPPAGN